MSINVDNSRKKQQEGVWANYGGSRFKIANTSAVRFQRLLTKLQAPYRKKIERGTMDPEVSRSILCEAMGQALLVDWADVVDKDGATVEFSPEMAVKALQNNDDLREFVSDFAIDLENFKAEETVEAGKS
jgi:hypothetical protein